MFQHVAILHNPQKPEAQSLAERVADFLRQHGISDIRHTTEWEAISAQVQQVDLLITLGGDGSLLHGARVGAIYRLPMLGIKMGRLGFLAEIQPDDWQRPLTQFLAGDYWIEERMMVRVRVERKIPAAGLASETSGAQQTLCSLCEYDALNDVVFSRGDLARVVRISAWLDGGYLTQYTCDGLIVSTATGSTGYALAAGGPILPPEQRNMLLIPVAPHLSMDRAVVLSENVEVRLRAYSEHRPILTVDGQVVVEIEPEDEVVIVASPYRANFIRLRDRSYFYQNLMDKMRWAV